MISKIVKYIDVKSNEEIPANGEILEKGKSFPATEGRKRLLNEGWVKEEGL